MSDDTTTHLDGPAQSPAPAADAGQPPWLPPGWDAGPNAGQSTPPWAPPPPPPSHSWSPEPSRPGRRGGLIAALLVAAFVVGAAVAVPIVLLNRNTSSSNPSGGPLASAPPQTSGGGNPQATSLYQQALSAVRAEAGCHYVATSGGAGATQTIVGDATADGGKQVITVASSYGNEQFTLLLSGGVVYFEGNEPALEDQLGLASTSAPNWQSKWIAVHSGDGPYSVLQPGISVSQQAQQLGLVPDSTSSVTVAGATATRLRGSVPPENGAPAGTGYIDLNPTTHLPIDYVTNISADGVNLTSTTTFSNWGTAITVSVPSNAVAWSTLGASEPPGGYGSGGGNGGSGAAPSSTPATI